MRVARRGWWRLLGPGFVAGASDVDPANIGAYVVSGATLGTIERICKWLALTLLAYVVTAFLAHPAWWRVLLGTFLPVWRMDRLYLTNLVALLGAAISPYLFFWQSSVEVEETRSRRRQRVNPESTEDDLRARAWDVNSGTLFANVIGYFIILASAATLHQHGVTRLTDAAQAARALEPLAGPAARYLFGLGLVGAGFLAVPVFTSSTAYLLAETFSWKSGLNLPVHRAPRFYRTIVLGTATAALLGLAPLDPLPMLVAAATLNGLITPPLLALVMVISSRRDVLGHRVNGPLLNALGWATTLIMAAAAAALVWTWVG